MDSNQIIEQAKTKFKEAESFFETEAGKLRTGRAHPSMLDGIMVEAYGSPMPLNQVATISAPEPQLIQISPFDPNNLEAITNAIREDQALGFNPVDDGRIIRVQVPLLTEERRRDIVKQLHQKLEDSMIRLRNARHEALKDAENAKKQSSMSEDELKNLQTEIDSQMQETKTSLEGAAKTKESEIMTV